MREALSAQKMRLELSGNVGDAAGGVVRIGAFCAVPDISVPAAHGFLRRRRWISFELIQAVTLIKPIAIALS